MACGKPMIMSNFKYWQDVFGESSLYVDPLNSQDIALKIKELLDNKGIMEKMSKENLKLSQDEYNWDKESQKLIKLYKEIENA